MRILIGTKQRTRVRHGLVLLLALGMLALFSLLAVTYVVSASNSRAGAQAMKIRANASANATTGMSDLVLRQALRGTRDQKSVFYQHSLLEDVYGQHPIRGRFGHLLIPSNAGTYFTGSSGIGPNPWVFQLEDQTATGHNFVKLSLFPKPDTLYGQDPFNPPLSTAPAILSPFENAYNSRLITILEGPLTGQSFRILKYVGYVRTGSGVSTIRDPNYQPTVGNTIQDPDGTNIDYSILIDLSELEFKQFSGTVYDFASTTSLPFQGKLSEWLAFNNGLQSLFYRRDDGLGLPVGYAFVINDAAFNQPGIGLGDIDDAASHNTNYGLGFGNLDARSVMAIPSPTSVANGFKKVPPALLPNYDYLQNPRYVNPLARSLGNHQPRQVPDENILRGSSNEGFDVPDWRDFWLAHQSNLGGPTPSSNIIPSFHRPELIHYLAQAVGTSSPSSAQLAELIRLIDASTGRVMSYSNVNNIGLESVNPQFSPRPDFPRIQETSTPADIVNYIAQQILGPWDVDNDFDGIADSVWIDPNLPTVKSPDGKLLKPLAAVLIQDLDGNININAHGDRSQANGSGFDSAIGVLPNNTPYTDGFNRGGLPVPQGLGFGPADTSLRPLRDLGVFNPATFQNGTVLSFFDDRYGIRRTITDIAPGVAGDDTVSFLHARDRAWPFNHGTGVGIFASNGAPLGVRSDVYAAFDRYGNLAYQSNPIPGANPTVNLPAPLQDKTNPTADDAYEFRTLNLSTTDDPFTFQELESILRKFDQDAASLPSRIKDKFVDINAIRSEITRLLTTRSVELKHPVLAAAMTKQTGSQIIAQTNNPLNPEFYRPVNNGGYGLTLATGNDENLMGLQGLIKMLHEQRYRRRPVYLDSNMVPVNDPELTIADINVLFGQEFAQGKKLDLNRPFENGFDDNGNGIIDEPEEVDNQDRFQTSPTPAAYRRGINVPASSVTRAKIGSRQVLARNLYCLAQLIVPRDYRFPGMGVAPANDEYSIEWHRIRARNLAQWAINVVDFRDNDSVCTRFEYDILPFGYTVRRNPMNNPDPPNQPGGRDPDWAPDRIVNPPNQAVYDLFIQQVGTVWGMEMPELLLTESLAFHDKRLRDTDLDNGSPRARIGDPADPQEEMDQYRFPQGSLFLELYAPRTTTQVASDAYGRPDFNPNGADGLYQLDPVSGQPRLDLQARSLGPGRHPVWRIGITDVHPSGQSINELYQPQQAPNTIPAEALATKTLEFNQQPQGTAGNIEAQIGSGLYADYATQSTNNIPQFDRMIWFLDEVDAADQLNRVVPNLREQAVDSRRHQVYFRRSLPPTQQVANLPLLLQGGEYLTLMPRVYTPIGTLARDTRNNPATRWPHPLREQTLSPNDQDTLPIHTPSPQALFRDRVTGRIRTTLLSSADSLGSVPWAAAANATPSTAVVIATNEPRSNASVPWNSAFPYGVGLNISMPHPIENQDRYWFDSNVPRERLNSGDIQPGQAGGFADLPPDTWVDVTQLPLTAGQGFRDVPFDYDPGHNPILADPNRPMFQTGTYTNVRSAVLQRLANPREEWNEITNPYLTVDWISLDLTVYNGEAPMGNDDLGDPITITGDRITSGSGVPVAFQSRYKDGDESKIANNKRDVARIPGAPGDPIVSQPSQRVPPNQPKSVNDPNGASNWGLSYHSSSTAQLRETPIQRQIASTETYDAYFPVQLGYSSQMTNVTTPVSHNSATTLGYVNVGYHFTNLDLLSGTEASRFDGFGPPLRTNSGRYAGYPSDLTAPVWLNRPFATTHELMLVPYTSAARYGISWNLQTTPADAKHMFTTQLSFLETNPNKVDVTSVTPLTPHPDANNPFRRGAWGQYDARVRTSPSNPSPPESDMALLFDFVELPSPFCDTTVHQNGRLTASQALPVGSDPRNPTLIRIQQRFLGLQPENGTLAGGTLLPPFNQTSTFRNPGKVNLNTMRRLSSFYGSVIPALRAVEYLNLKDETGVFPFAAADYDEHFFFNRRGYQPTTAPLLSSTALAGQAYLNAHSPTQFAGAYRPQLSAIFSPDLTSPNTENSSDPDQDANEQLRSRYSTEAGILRSRGVTGRSEFAATHPRPGVPHYSPPIVLSNNPIDQKDNIDPNRPVASDANRNAFTRYQRMMRLPNLVTDQSNVFAVWVTVGLFEYDPITGFGREYVNASGEEQRERSFYIIDRTVPVGFVPGEDLNTDKAILLRRKISGDR